MPRLPASLLRLASDERLVALARDGSEAAFGAIFERHHRPLLAFCRHLLGSAEEAEDAVQHTFLAAYRGIRESSRRIDLRPWLFTIARNRCLSVLRSARARSDREMPEVATDHLSAEVQRRQDLRDLLADVARLPDEQREALLLSEVGALTHAQVAEVIGVSREKVKSLVFMARTSLIATREARETPCEAIREAIATERGKALRRSKIRRHMRDCAGCRAFGDAVAHQRRMLAIALPVAPSLALKSAVLGGVAGGGATVTATAAKTLVVVAIAGGGTAAGVEVAQRHDAAPSPPAAAAEAAPVPARSAPPPAPRASGPPLLALPEAERRGKSGERRKAARPRDRAVVQTRGERHAEKEKHVRRSTRANGKDLARVEPGRGRAVRGGKPRGRERRGHEKRAVKMHAVRTAPGLAAPKRSARGKVTPAPEATPVPAEATAPAAAEPSPHGKRAGKRSR